MGRLTRGTGAIAALVLLVASCTTAPHRADGPPPVAEVPAAGASATEAPARWLPGPPVPDQSSVGWEDPSSLDLEHWAFGWVSDDQAGRLGLGPRFWSDQKALWTEALDPRTPPATAVRRLTKAANNGGPDEALRAAWRLYLVYSRSGLGDEARAWLDRAAAEAPSSSLLTLERLWDQTFRLGDRLGGQGLWPPAGLPGLAPDDALKARLLRQKLFLGTQGFADVGADGFVSALVLDRDDLWAATWNGSVVRWSLVTGERTPVWSPTRVAPVNRLVATGWFLYAFQDQGLLRYSKVTGEWRTFAYPSGWTGLRVTGAVADGEQTLVVGYLGQGLWRWDGGLWTNVDAAGGGPFVTALAADGRGGYLVGTKDRGLWTWSSGVWARVPGARVPDNISVLADGGGRWAVGTWGEGTWTYDGVALAPVSTQGEFVTAAAWSEGRPLWGLLDEGLRWDGPGGPVTLGPRDGLPAGGVTSLAVWEGRWLWGTSGQGIGWWSEHEDPTLLR